MSIEKMYGMYYTICDVCHDELPPTNDFDDAVVSKKANGWQSKRYGEDWTDKCPNCQE